MVCLRSSSAHSPQNVSEDFPADSGHTRLEGKEIKTDHGGDRKVAFLRPREMEKDVDFAVGIFFCERET